MTTSTPTPTACPFAEGDWVFCEFELQQVIEVEEGRVTDVSNGVVRQGGYNLTDRCFPLTMRVKQISDDYHWNSQRIHKEGHAGLNYPDIHRWLVDEWAAACREADNDASIKARFERLRQFTQDVLGRSEVDSGYGFPLIRRR